MDKDYNSSESSASTHICKLPSRYNLCLLYTSQLGRSFEFALPKEWSRQEQIQYTADYIKKTFADKGMCADWSIHDKGLSLIHI